MISFAGHLRLEAVRRDDGRTALAQQSFRAPFHLSKPYWDHDTGTLLAQVVNPTAGILSGDRLVSEIVVDRGASLVLTTPSASRVFTMTEGVAEARQSFRVATDAWLEVSPEPLVPHRASRYRQTTAIEIEPGGGVFFVDQLMPGRLGHGEAWSWSELQLTTEVRLGGELVLREHFAPAGSELRAMAEFAGSGATACFANATLISVSDDRTPEWRAELAALHRDGNWIGVSALRRGGWTLKVVTSSPVALRETIREVRSRLAKYFPKLHANSRKL